MGRSALTRLSHVTVHSASHVHPRDSPGVWLTTRSMVFNGEMEQEWMANDTIMRSWGDATEKYQNGSKP
eukprot:65100-Amphidinium_carterae.1